MTGRTGLPRDGGLFRLFHQAPQTHFRSTKQFQVTGTQQGGQEREHLALGLRRTENALDNRIRRGGRSRIIVTVRVQQRQLFGITEEPGNWNAERLRQCSQYGRGRIEVAVLNGFKRRSGEPGSLCQIVERLTA